MEKKEQEAGPGVVFTNKEFEDVTKYLIGNNVRLFPNLLVPQVCGELIIVSMESSIHNNYYRTRKNTGQGRTDDAESHRELCL